MYKFTNDCNHEIFIEVSDSAYCLCDLHDLFEMELDVIINRLGNRQ